MKNKIKINQFESTVNQFITKFNAMCKTQRKDFLIRERMVTYESGTGVRTYNVTYKAKINGPQYEIYARSGFWIFGKSFPLFKFLVQNGSIIFHGMYTKHFPPFPPSELEVKLNSYIEICKKLPKDAFVRS